MALGYLFLAIAVIAGAIKGHCGKRISGLVSSVYNITLMNVIRMILCVIIGFFVVIIASQGFSGFQVDTNGILISLFSGFVTSFFIITWTLSVKKGAFSMISIFLVLSTIIPVIITYFVWGEEIRPFKIVGFVLLLVSTIFMWFYNKRVKGTLKVRDIILLILCGLFNGGIFFAQKWRVYTCKETLSAFSFNFYSYVFAFTILLIFYFLSKKISKEEEQFKFKGAVIYVIILSVCLFLNSLFSTFAAERLSSSILYPLSNGLGLIISTGLGHFLYGEKINKISLIGVGIALISFVFMVL